MSGSEPRTIRNHADLFWRAAQPARQFPRDMGRAIAFALPVAVIRLPDLTIRIVSDWLRSRGISAPAYARDRPLKGCLYAHAGHGLIFVDGRDGEKDLRFALAHEAAHFILHHQEPRRRAVGVFGRGVLEVFDGHRTATAAERLAGVLRGVTLGPYIHAIGRGADGRVESGALAQMEADADLLAFELLAPASDIAKRLALRSRPADWTKIAASLAQDFGLPDWAATDWSQVIAARYRQRKSYSSWLRGL